MPPKIAPHPRAWGTRFDSLPSVHTSPPLDEPPVSVLKTPSPQLRDERHPHDASVFVGSLPNDIDHDQLARLLEEHLSDHTAVKSVKIIRDMRGGVSAFVQCQDAASASTLIETLRSTEQKPFFGRILRYEPARAVRTLLISYRIPMQIIPFNGTRTSPSGQRFGENVELDLPFAMRLWKNPHAKFHTVVYNKDATEAESRAKYENETGTSSMDDRLFFHPLAFNADTIHQIAAYFGPLEKFNVFQGRTDVDEREDTADSNGDGDWTIYPPPHDVPRTPNMDKRCWEIKWEHRDDCISALLTLRKIPHLTVSWIHQLHNPGFGQRSPTQFYPSNTPYSFNTCGPGSPRSFLAPPNMHRHQYSSKGHSLSIRTTTLGTHRQGFDSDGRSAANGSCTTSITWTEDDFPPLGELRISGKPDIGVWSEQGTTRDNSVSSRSPGPPTSVTPASEPEEFSIFSGSNEQAFACIGDAQAVSVPSTPGLEVSHKSPMSPPSQFPNTPTSPGNDRNKFLDNKAYHGKADQAFDPTTIFVGGLEMYGVGAWDEEKIRNVFKKFEGLESVDFVRPPHAHTAFAFVKFNNTESPARAVQEEHNRVYDGRTMRVQLRGANPPNWRQYRGRGRFQHHHFTHWKYDFDDQMSEKKNPEDSRQHGSFSPETGYNDSSVINSLKHEDREPAAVSVADVSPKAATEADTDTSQKTNALVPLSAPSTMSLDPPSSPESYHEYYEGVSSAPGISSTGPSMSAGTVPAAPTPYVYIPSGGYYPPPVWMPPYGHAQYPSPYYGGYPSYHAPGHQGHPSFANPPEVNGPPPAGHAPWPSMSMYGSYISYPTHSAKAPSIDQPASPPGNSQPPVVPTGFIQNEHGTLIAVYQPEALDRYMSATGGASSATVVRQPAVPYTAWSQYPQAQAQLHPYPTPLPLQAQMTGPLRPFQHAAATAGWSHFEQPPMHMLPHAGGYPHPAAMGRGPGFRERYNNNMGSMKRSDTLLNRGKPNRKDQPNAGRHGHARSWGNRPFRANMRNSDHSDAERQDGSGVLVPS